MLRGRVGEIDMGDEPRKALGAAGQLTHEIFGLFGGLLALLHHGVAAQTAFKLCELAERIGALLKGFGKLHGSFLLFADITFRLYFTIG